MGQIKKFNEYFESGKTDQKVEEAKNQQIIDMTYIIGLDVNDTMNNLYSKLSKQYTKSFKGKKVEFITTQMGGGPKSQGKGIVKEVVIEVGQSSSSRQPYTIEFITEDGKSFYDVTHIVEL
jgi:hypothetical protein